MSIQSNINQGIYIGGLALQNSLEGYAQTRRRGKALQAEAEAAQISLDDIQKTLSDIESDRKEPLSEYEKKDVEAKIHKNVNTIYDAVTAADNPELSKYIDKNKFSPDLTNTVNSGLEKMGLKPLTGREARSNQLKDIENLMKQDPTISKNERERILANEATKTAQDNKRRYSPRFNLNLKTDDWGKDIKAIDKKKIDKWEGKLNVLPEVRPK